MAREPGGLSVPEEPLFSPGCRGYLHPLPDSWIVHYQSLGIYEQVGGKVALQTFVAVDPAGSCTGKAGIALLNWPDREIWNRDVGDQEIR